MSMGVINRRNLLQMFGIGATITPMAGGVPVIEAAAKLLAVPQVEILQAKEFPNGHGPALWADRLKWNPYEAIWLYMWQIENNPPSCVNYGIGVLEHLLGRAPTEDEKQVGAAIMQWFGTNCGHAFIMEALQAAGYNLTHTDSDLSERVRRLQRANIWHETPPAPVRIKYRGREIDLEYGNAGRVL